jgi:hypothetical protein
LIWVEGWLWVGLQQAVDAAALHQVDADQAGESERALDHFLGGLGEAQQQEGDQRHGDLDAHGVLRAAEEAGDLQRLLDPVWAAVMSLTLAAVTAA